jgi:ligand-binding sensor domain-containing protein
MTKYFLNKKMYSLLFVLLYWPSCNGQTKTELQTNHPGELTSSFMGQPTLTKTQGSNEYQSVRCGIQDRQGNIWFGTTAEGVYKYDGTLFTQFTMKEGLASNCVWSIMEDKTGTIWFGTGNGICRTEGNTIISIPISSDIRPVITDNSYYTDWSTKSTVWSMLQDKSGKIWFGTGDGVYGYDGHNFTRLLVNDLIINEDNLKLKLVSDILEDKKGNIWFASAMPPGNEGICRYDGKKIESFKPRNEGWIRNVVESKNGNLLFATRHYGIWTYDGKSFTDYSQPKELLNNSLSAILEDTSGNLWIASSYGNDLGDSLGGLWYSTVSTGNPTEKIFTKIFDKEVYFMLEDKDHTIWFSTSNMGLYRYDKKVITKFSE